jgi:hypothetical protein
MPWQPRHTPSTGAGGFFKIALQMPKSCAWLLAIRVQGLGFEVPYNIITNTHKQRRKTKQHGGMRLMRLNLV